MEKRNLKTLINDLERAIAEIKSEVYSDTSAYRIDSGCLLYTSDAADE